jgi:hypothetical protein
MKAEIAENRSFSESPAAWHGSCLGKGMPPRAERIFREAKMLNVGRMGQSVVAMIAAMLLTATAVGAAVGPARALETAPVSLAHAQDSGQAIA